MKATKKELRKTLIREAWLRGRLSYLVRSYQRVVYDAMWQAINDPKCLKYVVNIARRFGKSVTAMIVAFEYAIRNPNSIINFICSTQTQLKRNFNPIVKLILHDCPEELKPLGNLRQGSTLTFPNGSTITFAGVDSGHADSMRGSSSHLNIIDEAGSIDHLEYAVSDVLIPQQLTTGGTLIALSTPAAALDHYYTELARECKEKGNYICLTIHDNKSIDEETLEMYAEESGGFNSTTWKREYLSQFVNDSDTVLFPEWTIDYRIDLETDEFYQYYHKYVAMDIGTRDFTAVLFGYYDFKKAALVVQDEYTINGPEMTTDDLADRIREKEAELWAKCRSPVAARPADRVYRRIADNNNLLLVSDMTSLHDLPFNATTKESLAAMVNEVRMWIKTGRLIVNPRCKMLIGNLENAYWNKDRSAFARSPTYKHFDHVAALVYLIRGIDIYTNPVPQMHGLNVNHHHVNPTVEDVSPHLASLHTAFKPRFRR
jgi:hypothetical protein